MGEGRQGKVLVSKSRYSKVSFEKHKSDRLRAGFADLSGDYIIEEPQLDYLQYFILLNCIRRFHLEFLKRLLVRALTPEESVVL